MLKRVWEENGRATAASLAIFDIAAYFNGKDAFVAAWLAAVGLLVLAVAARRRGDTAYFIWSSSVFASSAIAVGVALKFFSSLAMQIWMYGVPLNIAIAASAEITFYLPLSLAILGATLLFSCCFAFQAARCAQEEEEVTKAEVREHVMLLTCVALPGVGYAIGGTVLLLRSIVARHPRLATRPLSTA